MTKNEIERIKQGVSHAIAKAPDNLILRDLERAILTVEKYRLALEGIAPFCKVKYGMDEKAVEAVEAALQE